jgi:cell division protein FtsL
MMLRLVNLAVIGALVLAAGWVYEIKYSSTRQAERVAKLRVEIRRERDAIAALRAEWASLDNPDRIQILAKRHLTLKAIEPTQFDPLDRLPEKPVEIIPPGSADPIGALIETMADPEVLTGSVPSAEESR